MPRLKDQVLDCVFYLYPDVSCAEQGIAAGGTGFLVAMHTEANPHAAFVYAVTNSHVIKEGKSPVIRFKSKDGGHQVLGTGVDQWVHHPHGDDIAACSIAPPREADFSWINRNMFATRELVGRHNVGPGDDVCMVGRFVNHEGKQKNLPTVRFGNIAQMPWEPIKSPSRGILQESYLVECRSLPGSSGSPVFVYESAIHLGSPRVEKMPFMLLGLDWCHPATMEKVHEKDGKTRVPQGWLVPSNSGMAGVVPAWKIEELLDEDPFMKIRQQFEDQAKKNKETATVSLDVAEAESSEETVFSRTDFEDALKKVSRKLKAEK